MIIFHLPCLLSSFTSPSICFRGSSHLSQSTVLWADISDLDAVECGRAFNYIRMGCEMKVREYLNLVAYSALLVSLLSYYYLSNDSFQSILMWLRPSVVYIYSSFQPTYDIIQY